MIAKLKSNRVRRTYRGGARIDAFTLARMPAGDFPYPEDWMASTTTAFNGTLEIEGEGLGFLEDGRCVRDVVGDLPILLKLLDSDERLVIQAHPTVPFAKKYMNSPVGKTECWYFLPGMAADACVYLGFKPGITRERWQRCFETQVGLLECLHRISVKPGDFVFVEGGLPHAIGAGCFMIELQEPSDLMVVAERQTPSGRIMPEAKMHGGLGFGKMFDVYDYTPRDYADVRQRFMGSPADAGCGLRQIVGPALTDKFEEWELQGNAVLPLDDVPAVVVVTEGSGQLNGLALAQGERVLVWDAPTLMASGNMKAIVCFKRG